MADKRFFSLPVEKVLKREGRADVYVFRSGVERAKASDVIRTTAEKTSTQQTTKVGA